MSLLIDGRPLQTESSARGIGRYVDQIARAFGADERAHFLFFRGAGPAVASRCVLTPSPRRMITWTDAFFLPKVFASSGTTCYHSTAFGLPPKRPGVRYLMTVFDLTVLRFPQLVSLRHRAVFKRILRSARQADIVLCISEKTAADLIEFACLQRDRIRVVPCMLDERIAPELAVPPEFPLPGTYLLYVGGADPTKNLETLLQAVSRLQVPLVVAGRVGIKRRAELLNGLPPADRRLVMFTGYVSDAQLAHLYAHASALVHPSLNEGFGYSPLEALQCGTPAVVSRAGALPEVLGDAALYVDDPLAPAEWAEKAGRLLQDSRLQAELLARGKKRLPIYSAAAFKKNLQGIYFPGE